MPIPTEPVKRVCYADDLNVWASGVNIPDLEVSINNYLEEITAYLKDNYLLISTPKSSVTLLTPNTHQAKIHPRIFIENSHLPLDKCPRILRVYLDPSLSFNKHSQYVAERVSGRNNILKALAGTSWGQQKETLLMTYKAVGRSIINYAYMTPTTENPIRTERGSEDRYRMSQDVQYRSPTHGSRNAESSGTLRVTVCTVLGQMSGNVCHPITTRAIPERQMKETLYTRHRNTVEPMMVENDRKATLQALHTTAVVKAVQCHERNVVLDGRPPPISNSEKELTRKERSALAQLRSGYCRLLGSYKSRIKKDANLDVCADCGTTPHDVKHLFAYPAHPTTLIPSDLWSRPTDAVREVSYLERPILK